MFCFLFPFSGGQTDWPTSFKQGLTYFHQRVVNSYCVSRQSLVLWPDAGHGVQPASSRSQPPTELAPLLPSKLFVKSEISAVILKLWNLEWAQSGTGKITRLFFPDVSSARTLLRSPPSSHLTQILTGHCALKSHQFRFKFSDSPACECGYLEESVHHFLFQCPIFFRQRIIFRAACSAGHRNWRQFPKIQTSGQPCGLLYIQPVVCRLAPRGASRL